MTAVGAAQRSGTKRPAASHNLPPPLLETSLTLLTIAVGVGFGRLFTGWNFLPVVIVPAVIVHVSAAIARRVGVRAWIAPLIGLVAAIVAWTNLAMTHTGWGPLPSITTFEQYRNAIRIAFTDFNTLVAPVAPTQGFTATASLCLILCAWYADSAAFRGNVPIQAMTCHFGIQFFCAVFARGERQLLSAVVFAGAATVHLVAVRSQTIGLARWRSGDRIAGSRHVATVGSTVALFIVAGIAAPLIKLPLPKSATIDIRKLGDHDADRQVVSPLVSVETQLTSQSDAVMFTVATTDGPRYWRLTALDTFDGRTWTSKSTYASKVPIPGDGFETSQGIVSQDVTIKGLIGLWMPSAQHAVAVDAPFATGFDERTSTLIARETDGLSANARYKVWSVPPNPFRTDNDAPPTGEHGELFTEVPANTDPFIDAFTQINTALQDGPLDKLINLQNVMRTFEYSTDVDYSNAEDPMMEFLTQKRGFCQQFASTFALMARMLGLPSRVAVGFTYGNFDEKTSTWTVRGRHAHAWPEVFIPGRGWLPFEPTPSRGDPSATSINGVNGGQDETRPGTPSGGSGTSGSTATTAAAPPTSTTTKAPPTSAKTRNVAADQGSHRIVALFAFVLGLVLVALLAVRMRLLFVARRRSTSGLAPPETIDRAWSNATTDLLHLGVRPTAHETLHSYGRRAGEETRIRDVSPLANLVDERLFGPTPPAANQAAHAVELALRISEATDEKLPKAAQRRRLLGLAPRDPNPGSN